MALDIPDAPDEAGLSAAESLPFEIVTILAQDTDAVTYLARGFVSPSYIAVKILTAPDVTGILSRIHSWKPRLEHVRHSGISRFVDAGAAGAGRVYLATEYVAGSSLDYMLRHRTLTAADRIAIARQLSDAVAAMHAQGLAHLRLDASRIKVATSGGVRATILGLGASLIVDGLPPQPDLDLAALADVCRELGVRLP
jgi:eukaryotic-like serine/threonine-protein kinase